MGPLTEAELAQHIGVSQQVKHYAAAIDRDSARERLAARAGAESGAGGQTDAPVSRGREEKDAGTSIGDMLNSPLARTIAGTLTRGLMGALLPRRTSASRSTSRRRYF